MRGQRQFGVSPDEEVPRSRRSDDIFEGEFAARWIEVIGTYGDPIRASIVNPVVALTADHFVASPLRSQDRSPRNLIQQALHRVSAELTNATYESQDKPLHQWHSDTKRLSELYPHLKRAVVWDLGCGEGYLCRWLGSQGATCLGVDPSKKLHEYAKSKGDPTIRLFPLTISEFLKDYAHRCLDRNPNLLTLIAVLDGLANPDSTLDQINSFLRKHHLEIPILLTTFDPDFFCAGLPREPLNRGTIRIFGEDHPFTMRDPAHWELTFADHNFYVLDQRPIHLDALPPKLSAYVWSLSRDQILFDADTLDLVAPRQGPFYFWIIAPRNRTVAKSARHPVLNASLPNETISFEKDEIIEVRANLGSKVYELLEGTAHFDYAGLFKMTFSEGMFFGQMEVSQNYFASRMLGPIIALTRVVVRTFQLNRVVRLGDSDDFASKLFMSLIGHLDSVSFTRLLNSKHVKESSRSQVVPAASLTTVRNCAAVLLHLCAKNCPSRMAGYKARMLIELTYDDLQKLIYHDVLDRRDTGLMKTLALFVQSSIVDCFSANSLALVVQDGGLQDDIADVDEHRLEQESFLHLGLITIHYLRKAIGKSAAEMDMRTHAIVISAFLGNTKDQFNLGEIRRTLFASERHDEEQRLERGIKATLSGNTPRQTANPRTKLALRGFFLSNLEDDIGDLSHEMRDRISSFLEQLRDEFNFLHKRPYATHGFSKFIVVRDVWALPACAMDDKNIWTSDRKETPMSAFVRAPQQRHRLIAYYYECVAHIGSKCGLPI